MDENWQMCRANFVECFHQRIDEKKIATCRAFFTHWRAIRLCLETTTCTCVSNNEQCVSTGIDDDQEFFSIHFFLSLSFLHSVVEFFFSSGSDLLHWTVLFTQRPLVCIWTMLIEKKKEKKRHKTTELQRRNEHEKRERKREKQETNKEKKREQNELRLHHY